MRAKAMWARMSEAVAGGWRRVAAAAALTAALAGLAAPTAQAVTSLDVSRTERVTAFLHADRDVARPGDTLTLVLEHQMRPGWHTYWRNPGDGGIPTTIEWIAPEGVELSEIVWPAPIRFDLPLGPGMPPLVNFGYSGEALLLTELTVPTEWTPGRPIEIEAMARWLACNDICVPEEQRYRLSLPTGADAVPDASVERLVERARSAQAAPLSAPASVSRDGDALIISVALPELADPAVDDFYVFAAELGAIDPAGAQTVRRFDGGIQIVAPAARKDQPAPERLDGIFRAVDRSGPEPVRLAFDFSADRDGGALDLLAAPGAASAAGAGGDEGGGGFWRTNLIGVALLAALGGVILNLMPCVFPVLALKALAIAGKSEAERSERVRDGLAYGLGVIVSFWIVAGALLAVKAGGAAVGWGFQLQSPLVVAALAYVLFLVGLNLSGVFELSGPATARLMGLGASRAASGGATGSFFTGVLATAVASPCTAPFMGAALGFALTQDAATAMAVFTALAIGFAAPMVLLSLVPGLGRILPKPGAWMVRLRQALAFPMYLAAAWMIWVLGAIAGVDAVFAALIGLVLVALAAWALGVGYPEGRAARTVAAAAAVAAILGAGAALQPSYEAGAAVSADGPEPGRALAFGEAFDPERLAALTADGRPVFVNVTADWCISCKVNERLVLRGAAFQETLSQAGAVYMLGDWTRRDDQITAFLERFNRAGVPLYVYFPGDGSAPQVLPQILTPEIVRRAVAAG